MFTALSEHVTLISSASNLICVICLIMSFNNAVTKSKSLRNCNSPVSIGNFVKIDQLSRMSSQALNPLVTQGRY
jgi:hypothetical protein